MSERHKLPDRRRCVTHKLQHDGFTWYVTLGYYEDGRIGEMFLSTAKAGTVLQDMAQQLGKAVSVALQYGCPLDVVLANLEDSHAHSMFRKLAGLVRSPGSELTGDAPGGS